jgi:hypothetical protein
MQDDRNIYNEETHTAANRSPNDVDNRTGSDRPSGDGDVGQEQVNAIDRDDSNRPIGQDHSTDVDNRREPSEGVGAIQDDSQPASSRANIGD